MIKNYKVNNLVKFNIVKLIDNNLKYIGIFKLIDCLKKSRDLNFDLVEIGTKNNFSICKLLNYKKFKYLELKKNNKIFKKNLKNKISNNKKKIKEIKFHLFISKNDYLNKLKFIKKFLEKGLTVKATVIIKGRESLKFNIIKENVNTIIKNISEFGFITNKPNLFKKVIFLYFNSNNVKSKK
ncbi:Translation initiation factor 3 [Candidatus Nasuia deltocephalinicola str. NAS-ALF]|uniref:Translation initiation factor IF-3 n=1 Tax=Candidatus Nasuia deltocephalinicola str. NAS-ALF TaxID=1343077 RepID=S5TF11_9PROT|nr:Translation initiation factor 3 [Candidatus Nasuia deltocephalinicola str. NAS-ALF]